MDSTNFDFFERYSEGFTTQKRYTIDNESYKTFLNLFKDTNPAHTDKSYAISLGYKDIIVHGSMLVGNLANFTGTYFPGSIALTQSYKINFNSPVYIMDELLYECKIEQSIESVRVLILGFNIYNLTQDYLSAVAEVQVGINQNKS